MNNTNITNNGKSTNTNMAKMNHFLSKIRTLSESLTPEQRKEVFQKAGKELAHQLIAAMPGPMNNNGGNTKVQKK